MPRYNPQFKQQAVEKALSRSAEKTLQEVATELSIGYSTLQKWMRQSKQGQLEIVTASDHQEQRPQDWSLSQKFEAIMDCHAFSADEISAYCRERGIYPHHLSAWKQSFLSDNSGTDSKTQCRQLKKDVKRLESELNRKDKALSETAALLVLSKKCQAFWTETKDD